MMQWKLAIVVFLGGCQFSQATNYCSTSCGTSHTMCKYPVAGPSANCQRYSACPLTPTEKKFALDYMNALRNNVAKGAVSPQPMAANMLELNWDEELATVAQRWADQCTMGHDSCRITDAYPCVGQNIAYYWTTGSSNLTKILIIGMDGWFNENKDLPESEISNFTNTGRDNKVIGHYTQLVWAMTKYVGCGRACQKTNDGFNQTTLVCNFGPCGNIITRPIYIKGAPCSQCPSGTCSANYSALCKA